MSNRGDINICSRFLELIVLLISQMIAIKKIFSVLIFVYSYTALANTFKVIEEKADFPGYLFRPDSKEKNLPAIIFFHGSEGGNADFWKPPAFPNLPTGENNFTAVLAKHYASLGYVTYALCYFDCRHHRGYSSYPPDELVNVDLENYVYKAFHWLKFSPWVNGGKVAFWGGSRGAELTILLASLLEGVNQNSFIKYEVPDAIVASSPSDFVASPFTKVNADLLSAGELPKESLQNLRAWKFNTVNLDPGGMILTEMFTGPSLITFWENDNIWGPLIDIHRIINRYNHQGISFWYLQHANPQNVNSDFDSFLNHLSKTKRFFLEYKGVGHGDPMPNQGEARKLNFSIINSFLEKNLKN